MSGLTDYMVHDRTHRDKKLTLLHEQLDNVKLMHKAISHLENAIEHIGEKVHDSVVLKFTKPDGTLLFDEVSKEIEFLARDAMRS